MWALLFFKYESFYMEPEQNKCSRENSKMPYGLVQQLLNVLMDCSVIQNFFKTRKGKSENIDSGYCKLGMHKVMS